MDSTTSDCCNRRYAIAAAALLAIQCAIVCTCIRTYSATRDESAHLLAGITYWIRGDFGLYNVNPPLSKMIAAAAVAGNSDLCLDAVKYYKPSDDRRQEFQLARYFSDTNPLTFHRVLCRARLPGAVWAFVGGWLVWGWSCSLANPKAGLLAVALWVTSPMITGHSALLTCDVAGTVAGLAASFAFYCSLQTGGWPRATLSAVLLGLAILCKFTNLLLIPAWTAAWLIHQQRRMPFRQLVSCLILSIFVVNCGYGFQGTGRPVGTLTMYSHRLSTISKAVHNSPLGSVPCLLPEEMVSGIDTQQLDFEHGLNSYLRGEQRNHGWWYFYLYAYCVKSPVGHLSVYALALLVTCCGRQRVAGVLWITPLLIIVACSMKTSFTNNLRYILPAYPYLMIWAASHLIAEKRLPVVQPACWLLVGLSAVSVSVQHPSYIGYFNEAAGGSEQGWWHLADSNVDWGQDLLLLRDWLDGVDQPVAVAVCDTPGVDYSTYLGMYYPDPDTNSRGYIVADTLAVQQEFRWLRQYPVHKRIGTSFFVFHIPQE
jgi:hypothetical protein